MDRVSATASLFRKAPYTSRKPPATLNNVDLWSAF
jgi:hypothetical protein